MSETQMQVPGWQPIETAPTDVAVLLRRDGKVGFGIFRRTEFDGLKMHGYDTCWINGEGRLTMPLNDPQMPDAWMPLPDPDGAEPAR